MSEPVEMHRRTPDEMLAYWSGKHLEWMAERAELTARAEQAEETLAELRINLDKTIAEQIRLRATAEGNRRLAERRATSAEAERDDLRAAVARVWALIESAEERGEIVHPADLAAALAAQRPEQRGGEGPVIPVVLNPEAVGDPNQTPRVYIGPLRDQP